MFCPLWRLHSLFLFDIPRDPRESFRSPFRIQNLTDFPDHFSHGISHGISLSVGDPASRTSREKMDPMGMGHQCLFICDQLSCGNIDRIYRRIQSCAIPCSYSLFNRTPIPKFLPKTQSPPRFRGDGLNDIKEDPDTSYPSLHELISRGPDNVGRRGLYEHVKN